MKIAAAHFRLAGVLGRRSWCEWYSCVRMSIAVPFWVLVGTGKVRVAGGVREIAAVALSDDNRASSARPRSQPSVANPTVNFPDLP